MEDAPTRLRTLSYFIKKNPSLVRRREGDNFSWLRGAEIVDLLRYLNLANNFLLNSGNIINNIQPNEPLPDFFSTVIETLPCAVAP